MTVQSLIADAVSQSADSAQDILEWHPSKGESMKALAAFVLVPLALGQVVGILSATQIAGWYKGIRKPAWQPPAIVFGPVWSLIYTIMGVGAWQVWKHGGWAAQQDVLALWVFQLIFNLLWNPLFFLKHDMALALFDIGALWSLIVVLIGAFWRVEPSAAYLQLPYLAWVSFASVLNYTLLKLNTVPAPKNRTA
ncbi:hypothetical protein ABBQ32_008139 [Trebouxia sp. C0010 RCD-2024]